MSLRCYAPNCGSVSHGDDDGQVRKSVDQGAEIDAPGIGSIVRDAVAAMEIFVDVHYPARNTHLSQTRRRRKPFRDAACPARDPNCVIPSPDAVSSCCVEVKLIEGESMLEFPATRMAPVFPALIVFITAVSVMCGEPAIADEIVAQEAFTPQQIEFFEKEVRPVLAEHCYSCHSGEAEKLQAGLFVDSRAALLHGGDSGEAIVPGDVDGSLLIEAVRFESYEMPPEGKLPDEQIAALERWVEIGAPWPAEESGGDFARKTFDIEARKNEHWVWQPVESPMVPSVQNADWPRDDIDRFILARLESEGVEPTGDASQLELVRRLYFDLIGLPPTPEQIAAFEQDDSPAAIEHLVDELLASPHFGERWGRHWLDLVRYAESRGHEFDDDARNAFQYRDYIIRALNDDVPHDQLVREHIAGDLLQNPRLNSDSGFNESILGTGFWFLGEWVHSPVDIRKDESDRFDNMIDVMSKTFLGVTVACARCHDHKFDAISTADYYSLAGFLQSSDYRQVRFESIEHNRRIADRLAEVDRRYRGQIAEVLSRHEVNKPNRPRLGDGIVVNYADVSATGFMQNGFLFGDGPVGFAEPYWTSSDEGMSMQFASADSAISDPIWDGLESVSEKGMASRNKLVRIPRSGRTLRTPTFTLEEAQVSCRVRGAGTVVACVDSHRLVAGPLHGETIRPIKADNNWVTLSLGRYVGHRIHLEFTPAKDSQLEVVLVTQGGDAKTRSRIDRRLRDASEEVSEFETAARRVLEEQAPDLVASWQRERDELQSQIMRRSHLAMAMMDGTGEEEHVLIRGNSSKPGDLEPRHFLTALTGDAPMKIAKGSGRLELAEHINDPANPLTTRVAVNRIWHYLLGRGIVPTPDDFGVLGQLPSHPELLDYLATEFDADGRSIKRMIRRIVLTRTYGLSSQPNAESVAADPKNMLFHHRPPKRLEGEVIRDSLLALSSRLDPTLYGEPVPIHLTPFMDGRGRPKTSGPMDGNGRRSIYTAVRRNFLSPFMLTFDTPAPFSTMGRRNVSNVPAQALILMNDPFVVEQTHEWAKRAIEKNEDPAERLRWMYQTAFARGPSQQEIAVGLAYVNGESKSRDVALNDADVWADVAHALVNTKEFVFIP
ncbi:MAG: PSD1 and planctomycete cytochrome C domain-containing protein [Rhodopirellula sp. JB044]|uniref:PSD1 and planctomycete cytochrome C domain-containing protein n=1 Tax=Rhodopirellula sp. JB044 TaxID=3342844 RepID=UPI00370AC4C8